jgi:hypothetical protein
MLYGAMADLSFTQYMVLGKARYVTDTFHVSGQDELGFHKLRPHGVVFTQMAQDWLVAADTAWGNGVAGSTEFKLRHRLDS